MDSSDPEPVQYVQGNELPDLLACASSERWREIALVSESQYANELLVDEGLSVSGSWIVSGHLPDMPANLATLSGLNYLTVKGFEIGDEGARTLAALTGLTSLELSHNKIGDEGARALAALTGLTRLDLSHNQIGPEGARSLAALTDLTDLFLVDNRIGENGAQSLAGLNGLINLDLALNGIGDTGAQALAKLVGLTRLSLSMNNIGVKGAQALANLAGLTSLDLGITEIGDGGAQALAQLTGLTSLGLTFAQIGDNGARALSELTGLTCLVLDQNSISDAGARALVNLTGLISLDLRQTLIGDAGAQALVALSALTSLNLGNNRISDKGARALAKLTGLTNLTLQRNQIGNAGARALAKLTSLTSLRLGSAQIGDDGARALVALTGLTALHLNDNQIGDDGARALAALTGLTTLTLSGNPNITDLSCLEPLLPDNGGNLRRLDVHKCKGLGIPESLLREDDATKLFAAIRSLRAAKSKPLLEVKIVLLGEGRAGKSDLVARLNSGGASLGPGDVTADFEIHRLSLSIPRDRRGVKVACRIFDFGGQPELHSSHRFFLQSRRVVYLLVLDASLPLEQTRCDYWLRLIHRHGPDAPVVVVCTHADRGSARFCATDIQRLAADAGVTVGAIIEGYANLPSTELRARKMADRLQDVIAALRTSIAGVDYIFTAQYTRSFYKLMQFAEGAAHPGDFPDTITSEPGYKCFPKTVFNQAVAALAKRDPTLKRLHESWFTELRDLGCFHYVGDNKEVVRAHNPQKVGDYCYNPLWVKSPVYRIIRAAPQRNDLPPGMIDVGELRTFLRDEHRRAAAMPDAEPWGRTQLLDADVDRLIELMRACELLFDAGDGVCMVPDRMERALAPLAAFRADEVRAPLQYDYLPTSALLRFAGRWSIHIRYGHVRYNEVEVGHPQCGNAAARVRADLARRTVTIALVGGTPEQRDRLATLIVVELDNIEPSREGAEAALALRASHERGMMTGGDGSTRAIASSPEDAHWAKTAGLFIEAFNRLCIAGDEGEESPVEVLEQLHEHLCHKVPGDAPQASLRLWLYKGLLNKGLDKFDSESVVEQATRKWASATSKDATWLSRVTQNQDTFSRHLKRIRDALLEVEPGGSKIVEALCLRRRRTTARNARRGPR